METPKSAEVPVEVTKNAEPVKPEEVAPEVQATLFIHQALPKIREMVNSGDLTGVQAKNVLLKLLESPLEKETPAFTTEHAGKVFNLAEAIQSHKFTLFLASIEDAMLKASKEVAAEEQAASKTESSTNNEGENKNG